MKRFTVTEYQKYLSKSGEKVSKKTIYKRIGTGELKTITEKINNRQITIILVPEEEDKDFTPVTESSPTFTSNSPIFTSDSPNLHPQLLPSLPSGFLDFLQKQIEEKDRQIEEKDKQLAEKDKQIERIQQLLDQEQQLHARTSLLLSEYQKKGEEKEEEKQPQQEQTEEPKKERSWLYNLFFN